MSSSNVALRPWRVVARELAHEHNVGRILKLSDELDEAFGAQGLGLTEDKAQVDHGSCGRRTNPASERADPEREGPSKAHGSD